MTFEEWLTSFMKTGIDRDWTRERYMEAVWDYQQSRYNALEEEYKRFVSTEPERFNKIIDRFSFSFGDKNDV